MDINSIQIKNLENLETVQKIWGDLVEVKTLYDEWELRKCFYNENFPLKFLTAYSADEPVGFIPLQFNTDRDCLEFWGGKFMEYNRIFTKSGFETVSQLLVSSINQKADLNSMMAEKDYIKSLPFQDNTYNLDISQFNSLEDYLEASFEGHTKNRMKKKLKNFTEIEHKVMFNRFEDLEKMIDLNLKNFGEESTFNDEAEKSGFRQLLESEFKVTMLSVLINDIPESISYSVEYKDELHYFMAATNRESIRDLGNYLTFKTFEYAIQNKFRVIEVGRNDCNWKEAWHLTPHPIHIFKNF